MIPTAQSASVHVMSLCEAYVWELEKKYLRTNLKESVWSAVWDATISKLESAILRMKTLNEATWKKMKDVSSQY